MRFKLEDQSGFTVIETLLLILVLAVIGFGGFYVWHTEQKPAATNKTVSTTPATLSISATTQLLNTFFTKYIAADNASGTPTGLSAVKQLVEQYGTSNLLTYAYPTTGSYDSNPITCSQDIPTSFTVSGVTSTTSSATGTINEVFGTVSTSIKATVVSQSGSLKVDSVTCNPPLVPSTQPE